LPIGGGNVFRHGFVLIPDGGRRIFLATKHDARVIRDSIPVAHIDVAERDPIENADCRTDLPGITAQVLRAARKVPDHGDVLINCLNGRSRSPAVLVAYWLLRRHVTPRSAKARIQAFYDVHRTRQVQADREGRFDGCYEKMIADLLLVANFDVPMPSPHEIADSVRERNAFYAGLKELQFRALAPGIGSFTSYRAGKM
jgi:hypothetical protein